jgi:hypothetical protein
MYSLDMRALFRATPPRIFTRYMTTKVDVAAAQKVRLKRVFTATPRDEIIYALGCGAGKKDLDLVYEGSKQFKALPTFGVVPGLSAKRETDTARAFDVMWDMIPVAAEFMPPFNPVSIELYRLIWKDDVGSRRAILEVAQNVSCQEVYC